MKPTVEDSPIKSPASCGQFGRFQRQDISSSLGVPEHQNHRVPAQEELGDEAVLVHRLGLFLTTMWDLCPHLAHILKNHVAMAIEGFHTSEDFAVVAAIDEHLRVILDTLLQH